MAWLCDSCVERLDPSGDTELDAWGDGLQPAMLNVDHLDVRATCSACGLDMSREAQRDVRVVLEERAARIRLARTIAPGFPPAKPRTKRRSSTTAPASSSDSQRDVGVAVDPAQTLTVGKVGTLLNMTKAAVYAAAERGQLPGKVKLGGRLRFRAAAIRRLVGATVNDGKAASPLPERERG